MKLWLDWPALNVLQGQSIATRLFASAAFWSVLILLVAGIVLSALNRRSVETEFDGRLGVYLQALVADVATPGDDSRTSPGQLGEPQFEIALSGWYWQITKLSGNTHEIQSSRSLFAESLPKLADQGIVGGLGGSRHGYAMGPKGQNVRIVERVIDVGDNGIFLVQVAALTRDIEVQIGNFELALAITFLLLAAALILTTALQVRFGLEPLRRLQQGVAEIRQGGTERIGGEFPGDIAPLANELNLLIDANRAIVDRARTQVGNLAHALKTPLSVITNESDADVTGFGQKVREQASLMRDQVTYYLDRARVAASTGALGHAVEVVPVVEALVRTFGKIYRERHVAQQGDADANLKFSGEKQDLEEMIGNLVDNACKWANADVMVALKYHEASGGRGGIEIVIDDDGPGLPEVSRAAALRRGRRLDETKPGSGLGLSIVVDLAELYGGQLELQSNPAGGLRAILILPGG